jgi:hypothetical protein
MGIERWKVENACAKEGSARISIELLLAEMSYLCFGYVNM